MLSVIKAATVTMFLHNDTVKNNRTLIFCGK